MILTNDAPEGKPDIDIRPVEITAEECFADLSVKNTDGVQGRVTAGPSGAPNDHQWNLAKAEPGAWMAAKTAGKEPAYMTMAAFARDRVERWKGRSLANVLALQGFWLDVEGSEDKGGYAGEKAVFAAMVAFFELTGLWPTHMIRTSSGGVHLYYIVLVSLSVQEWAPRARALVALCARHGFKIDAQCTTDAARIMRAPGSIHQKTGKVVTAYRWKPKPYTLSELDQLIHYVPGESVAANVPHGGGKYDLDANGDFADDHKPYSYKQAAEKCAAMRKAAENNGQRTSEPVWFLAVVTADKSVEGSEYAHEISSGHPEYKARDTDKN